MIKKNGNGEIILSRIATIITIVIVIGTVFASYVYGQATTKAQIDNLYDNFDRIELDVNKVQGQILKHTEIVSRIDTQIFEIKDDITEIKDDIRIIINKM